MLSELLVHSTSGKYSLCWQWRPGDLAICDTRSTLHCGTDYDPQFVREMWRCTVMPWHGGELKRG